MSHNEIDNDENLEENGDQNDGSYYDQVPLEEELGIHDSLRNVRYNDDDLREGETSLVCGLYDKDSSKVIKDVSLVEMSGKLLVEISSPEIKGDMQRGTEIVVLNCAKLKTGENYRPITIKDYGNLLACDQDHLFLALRRLTKGNLVNGDITCTNPNCRQLNEVTFNLTDVKSIPPDLTKFTVDKWKWLFSGEYRPRRINATFRLPRVKDRRPFIKLARKNPMKALHQMALSCLEEWNGKKGPFPPDFFEKKSLEVFDWAIDLYRNNVAVGPQLSLDVICDSCGSMLELALEASDFLYPGKRRS